MNLVIDIGNTAMTIALIKGKRVINVFSTPSIGVKRNVTRDLSKVLLKAKKKADTIDNVLVCSVVPELVLSVKRRVASTLGLNAIVVGKDIKVPIINKYSNPKQVGIDRLVGAYGAKEMFGAPIIVIDLGTAITIDVVTRKGEYDGGIIIPGIRLSAESLFLKTALLPNVRSIRQPKSIVGKSTEESILSGVFFGYGAMCSGLVKELGKKPSLKGAKIVLTGGYTHLMKKYINVRIDKIEEHLVLKGLGILAKSA